MDGYSLETGDSVHAEEVALAKAEQLAIEVTGATLYSSLEPYSVRLSGKRSCTSRIIAAGIRKVVFAMREPPTFVTCEGLAQLRAAGIEVVEIPDLAARVAQVNQHLPFERG